jgi:hypothetical protein
MYVMMMMEKIKSRCAMRCGRLLLLSSNGRREKGRTRIARSWGWFLVVEELEGENLKGMTIALLIAASLGGGIR